MSEMTDLIDRLEIEHILPAAQLEQLLRHQNPELRQYLFAKSRRITLERFGNRIYTRGLIEFSNHCRCNCYYCGIRRENLQIERYRLDAQEILSRCRQGYALGFRTFVLQSGEDPWFTDERLAELVRRIKLQHPDCAVTLSVGERSEEGYRLLRQAGADRYLLRHETATPSHYAHLHPPEQTLENRIRCLYQLKELGYQVGAGFMVGSPGQTPAHLAADLRFLWELQPQMVGIGPFIPQHDTPFAQQRAGTLEETLFLLGILRLMFPDLLLPATTALGTIAPDGREQGILAGANVVMPNLSPQSVRSKYALYDNKLATGEEAAESWANLQARMQKIGYTLAVDRGDYMSQV